MSNQKREKYEPPAVEVLVVAVEHGFAGSGGGDRGALLFLLKDSFIFFLGYCNQYISGCRSICPHVRICCSFLY